MDEKRFNRIGWLLGFLISVILPKLSAPINLALDFALGGTIFGMTGFSVMYSALADRSIGKKRARVWAAVAGIVGAIATQGYRTLLLDPDHTTPGTFVMWVEFVLFSVAYCGVFALLAFTYRNGGAFVLQKFGKLSIPDQ